MKTVIFRVWQGELTALQALKEIQVFVELKEDNNGDIEVALRTLELVEDRLITVSYAEEKLQCILRRKRTKSTKSTKKSTKL